MNEDILLSVGLELSEASKKAIADSIERATKAGAKRATDTLIQEISSIFGKAAQAPDRATRVGYTKAGTSLISQYKQKLDRAKDQDAVEQLYMLANAANAGVIRTIQNDLAAQYRAGTRGITRLAELTRISKQLEDQVHGGTAYKLLGDRLRTVLRERIAGGQSLTSKKLIDAEHSYTSSAAERAEAALAIATDKSKTRAERIKAYKEAEGFVEDTTGLRADPKTQKILNGINKELPDVRKALGINTKGLNNVSTRMATWGIGTAATIATTALTTLPSYWHEDVTRSTMASRMASAERTKAWGQAIGGIAGGAAGLGAAALAGITGPIGWAIAAALAALGVPIGGLFGQNKQERLASAQATRANVLATRKDYYTHGGKTATSFGKALENSGLASAGSLNNMRWSAETLTGAMAFGAVGEQEMLMLSLMPEYYAALMNGEDAAGLAEAYQNSLNALPPQLRAYVGTSVRGGSQDMYSAVQDPLFNQLTKRYGGIMGGTDALSMMYSEGMMSAAVDVAGKDVHYMYNTINKDIARAIQNRDKDFYDTTYVTPRSMAAFDYNQNLPWFMGYNVTPLDYWTNVARRDKEIIDDPTYEGSALSGLTTELIKSFREFNGKPITISVFLDNKQAVSQTMTQEQWLSTSEMQLVGAL